MNGWAPPSRQPWPFEAQAVACGLEVPTVTPSAWHFLRGRLMAHRCTVQACRECAESRKLGLRTVRVTAEEVRNGIALDRVAGVLWGPTPKGGLF